MEKRTGIKMVDATMRDGGLVNDFRFEDDFVKALYETNQKTGVDYMEFGYKASKRMFSPEQFGKWKFCDDEDIRRIVGDKSAKLKIAVMADVGRCDYREDIRPCEESPIDMIRVATYKETIREAAEMIDYVAAKGYEVSCNIMGISSVGAGELHDCMQVLQGTAAKVIYLVDSYGAMYPQDTREMMEQALRDADAYGKQLGLHAHDNIRLAFANTILAYELGATWLDGTYDSMGRGAGNCPMESLLGFCEHAGEAGYHLEPAISFIDDYMRPLRSKGVVWGADLQYLMTGLKNEHPRKAIQFTKDGRKDHECFFQELMIEC